MWPSYQVLFDRVENATCSNEICENESRNPGPESPAMMKLEYFVSKYEISGQKLLSLH